MNILQHLPPFLCFSASLDIAFAYKMRSQDTEVFGVILTILSEWNGEKKEEEWNETATTVSFHTFS